MVELAMAPGKPLDEVSEMREKLVQLEAELQRHRESHRRAKRASVCWRMPPPS
jgi:hypothetical protein